MAIEAGDVEPPRPEYAEIVTNARRGSRRERVDGSERLVVGRAADGFFVSTNDPGRKVFDNKSGAVARARELNEQVGEVSGYPNEQEYQRLVQGGVADGRAYSRALFTNRMGNRWAVHGDPECMVFWDRSATLERAAVLEGESDELLHRTLSENATAADHVAYYDRNPLNERMVRWMGLVFGIGIWVLLSIDWGYDVHRYDSILEHLGRRGFGLRGGDWWLLHFVMPVLAWFLRRPLGYVLSFIIGAAINFALALYRRV